MIQNGWIFLSLLASKLLLFSISIYVRSALLKFLLSHDYAIKILHFDNYHSRNRIKFKRKLCDHAFRKIFLNISIINEKNSNIFDYHNLMTVNNIFDIRNYRYREIRQFLFEKSFKLFKNVKVKNKRDNVMICHWKTLLPIILRIFVIIKSNRK